MEISYLQKYFPKIFEGEMLIRSRTTILQLLCEFLLHSQVIFKSRKVADDTFSRNSQCQWVKSPRKQLAIQ